jgi:hypothetical protein
MKKYSIFIMYIVFSTMIFLLSHCNGDETNKIQRKNVEHKKTIKKETKTEKNNNKTDIDIIDYSGIYALSTDICKVEVSIIEEFNDIIVDRVSWSKILNGRFRTEYTWQPNYIIYHDVRNEEKNITEMRLENGNISFVNSITDANMINWSISFDSYINDRDKKSDNILKADYLEFIRSHDSIKKNEKLYGCILKYLIPEVNKNFSADEIKINDPYRCFARMGSGASYWREPETKLQIEPINRTDLHDYLTANEYKIRTKKIEHSIYIILTESGRVFVRIPFFSSDYLHSRERYTELPRANY